MANKKQLKNIRKNRCRGKCRKSVIEKRGLRLLAQDTLLIQNLHLQEDLR